MDMYASWRLDISELTGKVITSIVNKDDDRELIFTLNSGEVYKMYHEQDCCERVSLIDIAGSLDDVIGLPILLAECVTNAGDDRTPDGFDVSFTWTFYKLATNKGYATIRWYGSSNGYYSESVTFTKIK